MSEFEDDGGPVVIKLMGYEDSDYQALKSARERAVHDRRDLVVRGRVSEQWVNDKLDELDIADVTGIQAPGRPLGQAHPQADPSA